MTNQILERPVQQQLDMFSTVEQNEALLYHNPYSTGNFTLSQRKDSTKPLRQTSFPNRDLPAVLQWLFAGGGYKSGDAYMSQADFRDTSRRITQVSRIRSCWVDLDIYRDKAPEGAKKLFFMHDPVDRAHAVLEHCEKRGILLPSTIIHSGQGLYGKWLYSDPAPRGLLPTWNAVQKILLNEFASFASDPKSIDISRILRVCGSFNSKVPGPAGLVRVVWMQPGIDGKPKTYKFDDLTKNLFKHSREDVAAFKAMTAIWDNNRKHAVGAVSKLIKKAGPRGEIAIAQLWWDRFEDIVKLVEHRYDGKGIPANSGKRNTYCWIVANAIAYNCDQPKQIKQEIIAAFKKICDNFSDREIQDSAASVIGRLNSRTDLYKMSNEKFIEELGISTSEAKLLKTLGSGKAKKEKVKAGAMGFERMEHLPHAEYLAETTRRRQEAGKYAAAAKSANSADDRAMALKLLADGMSYREISREIGRSVSTLHRWFTNPE